MAKIDPGLRFLATQQPVALQTLATESVFELADAHTDAPRVNALIEFEGSIEACREAGFEPQTVTKSVASGAIALDRVEELAAVSGVRRIEVARALHKELDLAIPESRADQVHTGPPGQRGAGVVVGVIDSGVDFTHPAFRRTDGGSRILAIWDQALGPRDEEAHPPGFDYGVEYRRAAIDEALRSSDPFDLVRHRDAQIPGDGFHGTHVVGIAAGDGSVAGGGAPALTYVGVAPEADIVVVANNRGSAGTARGLGDSADTLDAIAYIFSVAEAVGRPAVINQSQGDNIGPHDGTNLLERGIDNLLGAPGRVMVKSAGNEGARDRHASGTVEGGTSQAVGFRVPAGRPFPLIIDVWYPGSSRLDFSITPPGGPQSEVVSPGEQRELDLGNGNSVFVDSDVDDPANGDNRIFVVLQASPGGTIEPGGWALTLSGADVEDGRWDAWIQRGEPSASFLPPFRNPARTISIPGTSLEVITAGSYVSRAPGVGTISSFSSLGPTRDGRQAPTIAAPGQVLMAPQPETTGDLYGLMQGTSMAAPMVAGAIALLLQRNASLTQAEVAAALAAGARTDPFTGDVPNNAWGAGKLDVEASLAAVPEPEPPAQDAEVARPAATSATDTAFWHGEVGY